MLRLLLLEDEDLLRLTLATAVPDESMEVVGAYGDAKSAIAAGAETAFDVLVTDLDLAQGQGPNGIVVANVLRRTRPEIGIVLLTSYADPRLVGTKLDQLPERTEYVRKHAIRDIDTLRAAIRRAALGANEPQSRATEANLTDTQMETMRLVAEGLSNAEIARRRVVTDDRPPRRAMLPWRSARTAKRTLALSRETIRVRPHSPNPMASSGRSAAWLAHQTGGLGVAGSNPVAPTSNR